MKTVKPASINVRDRVLALCSHGECDKHVIWDYETCWMHLTKEEQNRLIERASKLLRATHSLKGIILTGVDFRGFDFSGSDLSNTFMDRCNLSNCKFVDSNMERAFLAAANLEDGDLTRANLNGTVFSGAKLYNVKLAAMSISLGRKPINLYQECFGKDTIWSRPHIDESEPYFAHATYRSLKAYYSGLGDYDSASWASYSERLMQRKAMFASHQYLRWTISLLFGGLCGYGERPLRAFVTSGMFILLFSAIYYYGGLVRDMSDGILSPIDATYFSASVFIGYSYSDLAPQSSEICRLLATLEAFLGVFQFGLFIFTLTKKYVAR